MVVVYRLSPLTYWMARRFIKVSAFGMVNLVAGRTVVPEYAQAAFTPAVVADDAVRFLSDEAHAARTRQALREVREKLGGPDAPGPEPPRRRARPDAGHVAVAGQDDVGRPGAVRPGGVPPESGNPAAHSIIEGCTDTDPIRWLCRAGGAPPAGPVQTPRGRDRTVCTNRTRSWATWATALLMLLAAGATAAAQTNTAELLGVVVDESGAVLPGTVVVATHPASGTVIERITDGEGRFFLPGLATGEWTVTAELPGFQRSTQTGIRLEVGRTLQLEFTLALGAVSEEVTVEVSAPLLQTTTAEISDVIETREVETIPLNGRQFLQLAQLSDAVVIPPGGTRGGALQQAGPLPNVGGQRAGHNIYMLDGFKVTDELFNNLVINPSVDSIQEFKIQKSMYPPEFGGKASALINVATRSGANNFHGSLFEFMRDERFDAHNYFDDRSLPVPPLDQDQYGGTFGGPIVRDRTFFFASYERQDTRRSITKTFSVPDTAVRGGDFSGWGLHLRSADHQRRDGRVPALPGQPDSGGPARPHRRRVSRERAPADGRRAVPEPDLGRAPGQGRAPVQRARRPPAGRGRPPLPARSAPSTPTRSSRSAPASSRSPSCPGSAAPSTPRAATSG